MQRLAAKAAVSESACSHLDHFNLMAATLLHAKESKKLDALWVRNI
jgi:hypothetical protein